MGNPEPGSAHIATPQGDQTWASKTASRPRTPTKRDEQDRRRRFAEPATEKPEPNEEDKEKAAEMMEAYRERPTLVLPGTGGAVSGTAVGDWLDDDGNPKYANDEDAPAAKADAAKDDDDDNDIDAKDIEEQAAKDKEFNEAVLKDAKERAGDEEKSERRPTTRGRQHIASPRRWSRFFRIAWGSGPWRWMLLWCVAFGLWPDASDAR